MGRNFRWSKCPFRQLKSASPSLGSRAFNSDAKLYPFADLLLVRYTQLFSTCKYPLHVVRGGNAVLSLESFNLIDLPKEVVHMLQTETFRFRPEGDHNRQADNVDTHKNPVRVVTDIVEHDRPGLVDPECGNLLSGLRQVDPFVTNLCGKYLTGIDPSARPKGTAVCL